MIGYGPDLDDVEPPIEGAPRYFKRSYDLARSTVTEFNLSTGAVGRTTPLYSNPRVIEVLGYGISTKDDPHDAYVEKRFWQDKRSFLAWCFSEVEPFGELGFVPADECQEITREELEAGLRKLGALKDD